MSQYPEFSHILKVSTQLGECPVWSVREQALYFVDIRGQAIYRFDPASGKYDVMPVPEDIGCFGLREKGGFVAAMRTGIFLLDENAKVERKVADNPTDPAKSRFNDGRVDPWGRFWCGTIWEPRDCNGAKLCRLDPDLSFRIVADDIKVSNGLAFSVKKGWMYHSDTSNHLLYRYPLSSSGEIGKRELFKKFETKQAGIYYGGRPDGAAIDSEGCYWSAQFEGGRVLRFSPEGEVLSEIRVPACCPTMLAFGGHDLKTLFITSARENRSQEELEKFPLSGSLFALRVEVAGLEEPLFKG